MSYATRNQLASLRRHGGPAHARQSLWGLLRQCWSWLRH